MPIINQLVIWEGSKAFSGGSGKRTLSHAGTVNAKETRRMNDHNHIILRKGTVPFSFGILSILTLPSPEGDSSFFFLKTLLIFM